MNRCLFPAFIALVLLVSGCSERRRNQPQAEARPADGKTYATLLETLLAKHGAKEPIFIADCSKKPESPAMTALAEQLRQRAVKFEAPDSPSYQYYLNQLIPLATKSGKLWLVYDHHNVPLSATLAEGFISQYQVEFEQRFNEGALVLVSNRFSDQGPKRFGLEAIAEIKGTVTNILFTPDNALMLVSGKNGVVNWISRKGQQRGVALELPRAQAGAEGLSNGGESGLIGMALHPQFAANHKVYLHYTWTFNDGKRAAIISEWKADLAAPGKGLTLSGERRLLQIPQVHDNHNAGALVFGSDHFLYIAVGDGEEGLWTIGRSPSHTLRGKVLRIDVDSQADGKAYAIPADNPFLQTPNFPPETWAWGFRNPWRLALVPDGRLIASDIGEDVCEELTFVVKGSHHGWPYFEGQHVRNPWVLDAPLQPPLMAYGRNLGMSVIAGNVYEGSSLPELKGKFVFCDYLSGRLWAFALPETSQTLDVSTAEELLRWPVLLATITKDPSGELYFGAQNGQIFKLVKGSAAAGPAIAAPAKKADINMVRGLFGAEVGEAAHPRGTPAQVRLGGKLFRDIRLGAQSSISCASCHDLAKFGQDGQAVAEHLPAQTVRRNTPSIFNVHRQFAQFWDYRSGSVEQAVLDSLSTHLGWSNAAAAVEKLRAAGDYAAEFAAAFPGEQTALNPANLAAAIGSFLRELSTPSRWEQFLDGDDRALSEAELIGLNEFVSIGCVSCHQYRGLGGGMPQKLGLMKPWTGEDKGRGRINKTPGQEYLFKVPPLFNVARTAPYYHDGSMKTLTDAVRHMGQVQLNRELTAAQVDAVVTFLQAMTGREPTLD